jgi:hypothetical protein
MEEQPADGSSDENPTMKEPKEAEHAYRYQMRDACL